MKKFFVSMILCGSLLMSFTVQAADGGKVLSRLQQALQKEFAGASSVNWERLGKNDIYHATFVYNNELLNAFFDGDGGLVATGRNISAEGLPLLVGRSVKSKFCGYDVLNIVEYSAEGETSYL